MGRLYQSVRLLCSITLLTLLFCGPTGATSIFAADADGIIYSQSSPGWNQKTYNLAAGTIPYQLIFRSADHQLWYLASVNNSAFDELGVFSLDDNEHFAYNVPNSTLYGTFYRGNSALATLQIDQPKSMTELLTYDISGGELSNQQSKEVYHDNFTTGERCGGMALDGTGQFLVVADGRHSRLRTYKYDGSSTNLYLVWEHQMAGNSCPKRLVFWPPVQADEPSKSNSLFVLDGMSGVVTQMDVMYSEFEDRGTVGGLTLAYKEVTSEPTTESRSYDLVVAGHTLFISSLILAS